MAGISKPCPRAATLDLNTDWPVPFCSFSEADRLLPLHGRDGAVQPYTLEMAVLPRRSNVWGLMQLDE